MTPGRLQPRTDARRGATWPLSVAPMMDRTDRHYRYFMRQITRRTLLYTEMMTTGALLRGKRHHLLDFSAVERPLALQLGGDDPQHLAACARLAEAWGYDEVNLNVGCPSDRVQDGHFGACLMAQPECVARGVEAMRRATTLPVTVKHRIGIDGLEAYDDMARFVRLVARAGCDRFIVHARIAVLRGLSPRQNRTVPPLRYEDVYRLKQEFPDLTIEINGGITSLEQARAHLRQVDGVMIGRAAYDNPFLFALADRLWPGDVGPLPTRRQVIQGMIPYVNDWVARGLPPGRILRHLFGLFAHQRVAKAWKRHLNRALQQPAGSGCILTEALHLLPADLLDAPPLAPAQPGFEGDADSTGQEFARTTDEYHTV